ncbi:MAG: hypothetical protein DMG76_08340 [Acidobacteria bacterium]|nr:MAG: hypothetical protein DMG76_08340 [Acidobacteriota bacterium]
MEDRIWNEVDANLPPRSSISRRLRLFGSQKGSWRAFPMLRPLALTILDVRLPATVRSSN